MLARLISGYRSPMADGSKIHRVVGRTLAPAQKTVVTLTRKAIRKPFATQPHDAGLGMIVRTPNTPQARIRQLDEAIADIDGSVTSRTIQQAGDATERALEAIHELDDGRRQRQEWSASAWSTTELELLHAHVGARNASHHTSSR